MKIVRKNNRDLMNKSLVVSRTAGNQSIENGRQHYQNDYSEKKKRQ